jgi:phosphoglycerate dehydrogenase-like enzyme
LCDSFNLKKKSENNTNVCFIFDVPERLKIYLNNKLKTKSQIKIFFPEETSEEELLKIVPKANILIGWRPSKKILLKAKNLKLFINPGAGIHHLLDLFREINKYQPVLLANGHGNSYFVAQHAVALLLALMNKIISHHNWMILGRWRTGDEEATSIPLRYRKVGLLGYGHINKKIHQFLAGFNIKFSILRRNWSEQEEEFPTHIKKYNLSQLHDFLKEIDTLIIAIPLTSLSRGMIKSEELKILGSNGLLVNVGRGEIIDEESLYVALRDNVITGAAIDVWYNYHPESDESGKKYPFNFPFHTLDNVILSPHRGYSPFNDLKRWDEVIENIYRMAEGRNDFINLVNLNDEY